MKVIGLPTNIRTIILYFGPILSYFCILLDPDSDSSSDVSNLFGEPSSDEYQPNFDDLSDSDLDSASPHQNKRRHQNYIVIRDSDDTSSDDLIGPSDEEEGPLGVAGRLCNPQVNNTQEQPKKRKKKFFS